MAVASLLLHPLTWHSSKSLLPQTCALPQYPRIRWINMDNRNQRAMSVSHVEAAIDANGPTFPLNLTGESNLSFDAPPVVPNGCLAGRNTLRRNSNLDDHHHHQKAVGMVVGLLLLQKWAPMYYAQLDVAGLTVLILHFLLACRYSSMHWQNLSSVTSCCMSEGPLFHLHYEVLLTWR